MSEQTFTAEELASEEWRDVVGYEGLYRVSSLGRVWSERRRGLLALTSQNEGYLYTTLCANGNQTLRAVHALVLEAFSGPRPRGLVTRHFPDRDRSNNRITNLAWGTNAENAADRAVHGTGLAGESAPTAVLNDASVQLMRWLRSAHAASWNDLAEWFGVGMSTARHASLGDTWKHVSYGLHVRAAE